MDVDTALSEVPVNIAPLIDNTDFKTIEDAVAYNAAGMALNWHFVTTAGAYTLTAVTPTTGGNYDWTDQGAAGIYTIEIPASGGASINNDTEGFGWFTGVATGVLPWRGPTIGFRAAPLNDALVDGGDLLDVSVTQWLGTACATPTVAGVPEVDLTHVAGSTTDVSTIPASVAAILVDTGTTLDGKIDAIDNFIDTEIADIQARLPAALTAGGNIKADALALSGDTVAADNAESFFDGTGYAGTNNVIPLVTTTTDLTNKGDGSGFTAVPWNAAWDAEVQSEAADAIIAFFGANWAAGIATLMGTTIDGVTLQELLIRVDAGTAGKRVISGTDPYTIECYDMSNTLQFTITATAGGGTITYS